MWARGFHGGGILVATEEPVILFHVKQEVPEAASVRKRECPTQALRERSYSRSTELPIGPLVRDLGAVRLLYHRAVGP